VAATAAWQRARVGKTTPAAHAATFVATLQKADSEAAALPPGQSLFTDVALAMGLDFTHDTGAEGEHFLPEEMGPGAAFLDFDGDGLLDIFVAGGGSPTDPAKQQPSRLYRNAGDRFTDVTESAGVQVSGQAYGVACADYDDDGDVDIYVTRLGANKLLVNDGQGHFRDESERAGVDHTGFGASAIFFDYNSDGLLDIYLTNYVDWTPTLESPCYSIQGVRDYCSPRVFDRPALDVLYRNRGDGTFEDVSELSGITAERGNGLAVVASDVNGDALPDVFVANDQTPGMLWKNRGDGTFENIALWAGCALNADGVAIAGMGISCEDFNDDGLEDLLITNIRDQPNLLLENQGGSFADRSAARGMNKWSIPATTFGIAVFDQNHDGAWDGYFANGDVNFTVGSLLENRYGQLDQFARMENGAFEDYSHELGEQRGLVTRGVAAGDYDNDGDMDLLVTNNGGPLQLLRNNTIGQGNWLMASARSGKSQRHAIGARLRLEAGNRTQTRVIRPQQGYLTSGDPRAHFGLGSAERVARVEITWPDGEVETFRDLPVNQHLEFIQGSSR